MCNRNGNSRLMSVEDTLILNLPCVPLSLWRNAVCSFEYFEQCIGVKKVRSAIKLFFYYFS